MADGSLPLPDDAEKRRQNAAYIERRYDRADIENDEEDEGEAYLLGFSDGEPLQKRALQGTWMA
ncbi:hypothetical protein CK203_082725 [Vitis vinifera]|uniref:Uncharacterized protein n=1 Tax=Vitis vinifera TaxID=29760 RepID=A0A438FA07_VITVI|nr:hypothetical protein CK203_082725 [Vitis vinifera]